MFRSCFQLCHHTLTVTSRKVLCRNSVLTMKSLLMLYPYVLHTGCINARKIFALYFALKMMHSLLCDGRCRKINHLHEITLESMQWSTTESKKKTTRFIVAPYRFAWLFVATMFGILSWRIRLQCSAAVIVLLHPIYLFLCTPLYICATHNM